MPKMIAFDQEAQEAMRRGVDAGEGDLDFSVIGRR